jgi:hypothetical protein
MKTCPSVRYATREEAEREETENEAITRKGLKAMQAAHVDAKAKGFRKGHGGVRFSKVPQLSRGRDSVQRLKLQRAYARAMHHT